MWSGCGVVEVERAHEVMLRVARGGAPAPLSEHGVGKHGGKQRLLRGFYGESGVWEMRAGKRLSPERAGCRRAPKWMTAPKSVTLKTSHREDTCGTRGERS